MHDTALIVTVHPHALLTSLKIFYPAHDEAAREGSGAQALSA